MRRKPRRVALRSGPRPSPAVRRAIAESLETRRLLSGDTFHALTALGSENLAAARGQIVQDTGGDIFFLAFENPGANEVEAVGELAHGASFPTLLAAFPAAQTDDIGGLAIDGNGDLFGTTSFGSGSIWEIAHGSGTITTLASLSFATTGSDPLANSPSLAIDSQGNIFGTSQTGGANQGGAVWELPAGSGTPIALASFTQAQSNRTVNGITLDPGGNLFGTIGQDAGVVGAFGAVWELPSGSGTLDVIPFSGSNGSNPRSPLVIDAQGDIFGETELGGSGFSGTSTSGKGTLFKIPAGTNTIDPLFDFSGSDGDGPLGGLFANANGNIFGSTGLGGNTTSPNSPQGSGLIFELPAGASSPTTVFEFNLPTTGSNQNTGMIVDSSDDIFGTTASVEPPIEGGALYELTPGGGGGGGGGSTLSGTLTGPLPGTAIAGQTAKISQTLSISNTSASPASGLATVKLFLSGNSTVDSNAVQIGSASHTLKLKSHAHLSFAVKATEIPSSAPIGADHLVAAVTVGGVTFDAASSGTVNVAAPQIALSGSFSKFVPTAKAGAKFKESITVNNGGNVPAAGVLPVVVSTSPDGQVGDSTPLTTIDSRVKILPHHSARLVLTLLAPVQPATFDLVIQLDPANTFGDDVLANDTFHSAPLTVT